MFSEGFLFDETQVEKVADGTYEIETHEGWFGAVGLFGGFVNIAILRALDAEVNDAERLPRYLGVNFLRPYPTGRLRVETCVEREGSSVSVLSFRTFVGDSLCGIGMGTFGKNRIAYERVNIAPPPSARAFDPETEQISSKYGLNCYENFEIWIQDEKAAEEKSETIAWARLARDKSSTDALDSLFFLAASDIIPPIVTNQEKFGAHFMGTMDFTAHFRQPEILLHNEPVLARIYTAASKGGYVDEDCEIFSPAGELLLQSRQLRFTQQVGEGTMRKMGLNK